MSIYVILGTPGAFDFEAFSQATRKTLALLAPLIELQNSDSGIARDIAAQVSEFVRAVRLGTSAAQCGFTAAEDILTLANLIQSTTIEERTEYLNGTLELANQAYSQGHEAYEVFRAVRTRIYSLTEKFNSMANGRVGPKSLNSRRREDGTRRTVEELRQGIETLEIFGTQISALVQWWDWVRVETNVQRKGRPTVSFDDSSLRQRAVIDRWRLLRTQFVDYTNMVSQLEDSYPELLTEPIQLPMSGEGPKARTSQQSKRGNFRPDISRALDIIKGNRLDKVSCGCVVS
ncbi:hypothetical protein CVT25_005406 [Psilocybe cyanescens]|uniref:Uncharacterized protein n=1 Tax=Psilocybe cyanescens TaxID=93625 RepID=A0A409WXF0_PSICY|nr:hypothetical protein CVT25_005406 [Psilocybe cyanescens]